MLKLLWIARISGGPIPAGSNRILWGCGGDYEAVAVAGLGSFDHSEWDELERINAAKENVRIAAAAGCLAFVSNNVTDIEVEDFDGHGQSAAEGKMLSPLGWYNLNWTIALTTW